jgi:DNA polymerase III subunit epsilon
MLKKLYYDLETTGLFAFGKNAHGIHEIAFIYEENEEIIEQRSIKLNPLTANMAIDDKALEVGGITLQTLDSYQHYHNGYKEFIDFIESKVDRFDKKDKIHLVGYNNIKFDDPFLEQFFKKHDNKFFGSYFWRPTQDVMVNAGRHFEHIRSTFTSFKLKSVAEHVGLAINESLLHIGTYDVHLTREIDKWLASDIILDPENPDLYSHKFADFIHPDTGEVFSCIAEEV